MKNKIVNTVSSEMMAEKSRTESTRWLYFNIHDLVGIRVAAGHASERSVRLVFGPFETESLDRIDLTLQYDPPDIGEHSLASESYLYTDRHVYIKNYRLHLVRHEHGFLLASKRDLLPFVYPIVQSVLLRKNHTFTHGAAIAINGRAILLPGWGGTGKTTAIACLLREVPGSGFLADDYTIVSADGRLLSFPKAFFVYPYHRNLFPHLFRGIHKPLVPQFLSGLLERVRTAIRPTIMAFPWLENIARRITPEHMQIPARTVLANGVFIKDALLDRVVFIERYSGTETIIDELTIPEAKRRLIGNWTYEQGRCARDLILGAGATAVIDLEHYYSQMASVLGMALRNRHVYRLRIGPKDAKQTGQAIVDAVRQITSV
jgi:hypothetical protein